MLFELLFRSHKKEHGKHGTTRLLDGRTYCDSLPKTLQRWFRPVFHSNCGEGLVEALRLSNEALKRQLVPQSGRTQVVVFSMLVLFKNTHQNDPNRFLFGTFI